MKLTKNQTLVFDRLKATHRPQSAYELLDSLREKGLRAPLQIYRALDKLIALDLVHRLESLNAFVVCCQGEKHAQHDFCAFAICESCGTVVEFSDPALSNQLRAMTGENNFKANTVNVEIRGTCQECQTLI